MRILFLFLIILLFSCEKEASQPNVIFYGYNTMKFNNVVKDIFSEHDNTNPDCNSYWDETKGYWIMYLSEGTYKVSVLTRGGNATLPQWVEKTITIHEGNCNKFDLRQFYGWK